MSSIESTKTCSKCGHTYPATPRYFHRDSRGRFGLQASCKACAAPVHRRQLARLRMFCEEGQKVCSNCLGVFPASPEHFVRSQNPNGLASHCKTCTRAAAREYNERNSEQRKAYRDANKARKSEADREYRENNREKVICRIREWKKANPDKVKASRDRNLDTSRARARRQYAQNKEAYFARNRQRRARKKTAPGSHTAAEVWQLAEDQDHLCAYCESPLMGSFHVDHMVPLSRGGSDDVMNLAITCATCNLSKNARTAEEFIDAVRGGAA